MNSCEQFIFFNNLFEKGDKIGVGCSGGSDSLALLHFLATNQRKFNIEVVAIHVDHQVRENSQLDSEFVKKVAEDLGIHFYHFTVDVPKLANERGLSIETAGRDARYDIFKTLVSRGVINKVALAHHKNDQAETILMHIFRGAGIAGAKGMEPISEAIYVRPMLDTSKSEIYSYLKKNKLEYLEDYTNSDNSYNRNFVRNVILKDVLSRWPNAIDSIVNFGKSASEDDEFINSQIYDDSIVYDDNLVKIPTSYFVYSQAVIARLVFRAMKSLGINKDIERKHISLIKKLAINGDNGNKLNLPFGVVAIKEYDYLTLHFKSKTCELLEKPFKIKDKIYVKGYGKISMTKVKNIDLKENALYIDVDALPTDAIWRFRKEGDNFTKFGGKRKKLKSFLIDRKVPARIRDNLPVLASDNEILVVSGIEISDRVKVDELSKNICKIIVEKDE